MCSTPAARSAPRSRPSSATAAPTGCSWPCSPTAATASCRSAPTTSVRTCPQPATSASRSSSSRWTKSIASCSSPRRKPMGEIHVMREDFLPPKPPPRRHLISIGDLSRADVERLLATARSFTRSLEREVKKLPTLRGHTVVNVFYESSTRTSSSFELAAKRLSADTMSIKAAGSSVDKGESLKDTALTLGAYDPDVIVIRHPQIGAPQLVAANTDAHVVNAGDGIHSRVARSNVQALLKMGAHVTLVGPPALIPRGIDAMGCSVSHDIDSVRDADVVYVLRMQRERML